nr:MFS transporter [Methylobrevis albus]
MDASVNPAALRAGRREWLGLAVLTLPCLIYSMDLTVLNLAAPQIAADLKPSAAQMLWIVDIYGFLVAGSLITMGTLGDRIGRRRLLMIGALAFGAASILAAFAPNAELLIVARALLGIAGATLAPSTLSLLRNMFDDPRQRTFAISVWGTSYAAGSAIGPVIGGILLEFFWWGSVFLIALPVMALLLVVGPRLLPEFRDANAGRLDFVSAGLSLAAVLAVIYGLKRIAEHGIGWLPFASIAAGLVLGALFVRRQRRLADPLIDLALFRSRVFSTALGVNVVGCLVIFGIFFLLAQHLQMVIGLSPLEAGLWTLPAALAITASSMSASFIVARFRPATVIAAGFGLLAFGLALMPLAHGRFALEIIVGAWVISAVGLGPIFILTTDLLLGAAPAERAGAASAISETGAEFGGVLGIAVLGSVAVAVYRTAMLDVPAGLDLTPAAIAAARDTLGGAVAMSIEYPGPSTTALLDLARTAFSASVDTVAVICAVIAVAGAVAAWRLLRDVERPKGGHG